MILEAQFLYLIIINFLLFALFIIDVFFNYIIKLTEFIKFS